MFSVNILYLCACFNMVLEEGSTSDWEQGHGNLQGEGTELPAWVRGERGERRRRVSYRSSHDG